MSERAEPRAPAGGAERALEPVAFLLPFVAFVLGAGETAGFLDEGEFVAQGVTLGISHPPGQPLPGVLYGLATLVPFGSMALRVGLVSGVATAGASVFLYRASCALSVALGPRAPIVRALIGLGAALLATLGPAAILQAVRPEVYAITGLASAAAIERLSRHALTGDRDALVGAALALGLAASCHPFIAIVVAVAAILALASTFFESRATVARCAAAFAVGLVPLLYLPLRALRDPALNLGDPSTPASFFWVVSARAFQKNQGSGVPEAGADRAADAAVALVSGLGPVSITLALGGAYLALRSERTRRAALLLSSIAALTVAARAWLGFVRHNPDALGYLLPAVFALALLASAFVAILLGAIPDALPSGRALASAVALALAAVALGRGVTHVGELGRAEFTEADAFDDALRRTLPEGAVLFAYGPQTIFRHLGFEAEERSRGDVLLVPVPLLFYPGMIDRLVESEPRLRDALRSLLLTGSLGVEELQSLAAERPVLIELDPRVDPELFSLLVPEGVLHRVMAEGTTREDVRLGRDGQLRAMQRLRARLGPIESMDARAREALLLRLYNQALYYAAVGERDAATYATRDALLFAPESRELLGLFDELRGDGEGPIDVDPYRLP